MVAMVDGGGLGWLVGEKGVLTVCWRVIEKLLVNVSALQRCMAISTCNNNVDIAL